MARLTDDYSEFTSRSAEVIAIGPNGRGEFDRYWRAKHIPFVGIPDPAHRIARLYRQEVDLFKLGRMPLVVVIDGAGYIRYAHRGHSMEDIPENSIVLDVIERIQAGRPAPAPSTTTVRDP